MANLLDEASILLTPTAYNNGSMLAVKPTNGDGDFTFSRNSAATRVNAQGLVENVQILSSNLVSNGDFSQEGAELVLNPYFNDNTWWSVETPEAEISNGKANFNTVLQNWGIYKNNLLTSGKQYKVVLTIDSYTSGGVHLNIGGGVIGSYTAIGTYAAYVTGGGTNVFAIQSNSGGADLSVTNVSVKEVGQDWTLGTGWSIGDGKATSDGTQTSQSNLYQSGVVPINKTYKVTFSTVVTSGSLVLAIGGSNPQPTVTTSGTYTYTSNTTIGDSNLYFSASSDFIGSITNVSVKEITNDTNLPRISYDDFSYQDSLGSEEVVNGDFATDSNWNVQLGWAISGGTANCDGTANNAVTQYIGFSNNKTYKITFDVTSHSQGTLNLWVNKPTFTLVKSATAIGSYEAYVTVMGGSQFIYFYSQSNFIGSIDNVSVKEYLGQEVVPNSGCGSLLLEPQSTNSVLYSQEVDNAWWSKFNCAITPNTSISPDGTLNADTLTITNGASGVLYKVGITAGSLSFFAKDISLGTATFKISVDGVGSASWNKNGLLTSVVGATATDGENYGNGWYRFTLNVTSGTVVNYGISNGTGTNSILVFGLQNEAGATYPTSYIPTTQGAISTRLADIANNSGNASLINSEEGVLYAEISALADDLTSKAITINDTTANNELGFYYYGNRIDAYVKVGGVNQFFVIKNITDATITSKIALVYKENDFALWVNGVKEAVSTSGLVPTGLSQLAFGNGGGDNFYGKTKALAVYKTALTDEQLTALTTI